MTVGFLLYRHWRGQRLLGASVHTDGCGRTPRVGRRNADGSGWTVREIVRDKIFGTVTWTEAQGLECHVECPCMRAGRLIDDHRRGLES